MELDQGGDWSQVYHLCVCLTEPASDVHRVEYFWSHVADIEKAVPSAVVLAAPGADGVYRVPLTGMRCRAGNWLIIEVCYVDGRVDRGLVTARHFTDTNRDGHTVTSVSMLPRPPFARVKPHVPSDESRFLFTGDTVDGHRPEALVSRVYSTMDTQFRAMLFHVAATDKDQYIETLVRDTLARLAAPLAYKALYEQNRLAREIIRGDTGRAPESDLWGTCVLWTLCDELTTLTGRCFSRHETLPDCASERCGIQSAAGWLEVKLTSEGLVLSRRVTRASAPVTLDPVDVPYWAVILTAFCCGALAVWRQAMRALSDELAIDSKKRRTDGAERCQRCGSYYYNAPIVCPEEPARVLAVSQIDKILLGHLCTTLCARVFPARYHNHVASPDQRGLCLNHKRPYRASVEEEWDDRQERERQGYDRSDATANCEEEPGGRRSRERGGYDGARASATARSEDPASRGARECGGYNCNQASAATNSEEDPCDQRAREREGPSCPSSTEQHARREPPSVGTRSYRRFSENEPLSSYHSEQCNRGPVGPYARRKAQSAAAENEPEAGWWMWQKRCRDRRRGATGGVHRRKHRLWDLYPGDWGGSEHADGKSTSFQYWRDFSCRSMGHHVETFPFGHAGGPLAI